MALRLRRGLDVERQAVIFAEGEPIFTTDTKKIHIGDGSTPGGLLVSGLLTLNDDSTPRLGGNLDLNANDIVGAGNINIVGDITVTGTFSAGFIEADYRGSLFALDSSVIIDGNARTIHGSLKADTGETMFDSFTGVFSLDNNSLNDLGDVTGASNVGDYLVWDGVGWAGKPFGEQIDGSSPPDRAIAQFNSFNGWVGDTAIYTSDSSVLFDTATGYVNISNQSISELNDVVADINAINADDVLSWDGMNWVPKQVSIAIANISLRDLDDVSNAISATEDHTVKFIAGELTNVPFSIFDLEETNIDVSIQAADDVLTWDGFHWVSRPQAPAALEDISNVNTTMLPSVLDRLVWDGTQWTNLADPFTNIVSSENEILTYMANGELQSSNIKSWLPTLLGMQEGQVLKSIGGELAGADVSPINTFNALVGDVLTYDGLEFVPVDPASFQFNQAIQVDVLGQDSSVIIDTATRGVYALDLTADIGTFDDISVSNINVSQSLTTNQISVTDCVTQESVIERQNNPSLLINRADNSVAFAGSNERIGMIRWTSTSTLDTPNEIRSCYIIGNANSLSLAHSNNNGNVAEEFTTLSEGNMHIGGTDAADEKLKVTGNAKVTGFVQFGSYTTTERDVIAAQSGMVIFNTTDGKFQGYAVNTWVDLH
jgi:hypothetical protein